MTVCIGAISYPMVLVASDRMITSADIQFQQQQPKIFAIGPHTLALIAGDIAAQTELVEETRAATRKSNVASVADMSRIFADAYARYCQRKGEAEVLKPLGLSSVTELMSERKWSPTIVSELLYEVRRAASEYEDVRTIIAGVDDAGPHLNVIEQPGTYTVHDRIGFASVGIGRRHAESQFMLAGYVPQWGFSRALYLTYIAKKRAEVAPGVGEYTDLAVITTEPRNVVTLDPHVIPLLERIYGNETAAIDSVRSESEQELDRELLAFLQAAARSKVEAVATSAPTPEGLPAAQKLPTDSAAPESPKRELSDRPPSQE